VLEARAQSDVGRTISRSTSSPTYGREAIRLGDIYGRRGIGARLRADRALSADRWRTSRPLNAGEKADIIRAWSATALADTSSAVAVPREYAPLMRAIPIDWRSTRQQARSPPQAPVRSDGGWLRASTRSTASSANEDRYPDNHRLAPLPDPVGPDRLPDRSKDEPVSTLPQIKGEKRASAAR